MSDRISEDEFKAIAKRVRSYSSTADDAERLFGELRRLRNPHRELLLSLARILEDAADNDSVRAAFLDAAKWIRHEAGDAS